MGEVDVVEVADRFGTAGGSYSGVVYLPKHGGGDPNLVLNDIIGFAEMTDGTFVCVTDYMDCKVGTVKLWARSVGEIPSGWAIMNSIQNSAPEGSAIDTRDVTVRGAESVDGAIEGRDYIPEPDLEHRHSFHNTGNFTAQHDPFGELVVDDNRCQETVTADQFQRMDGIATGTPISPSDSCIDAFGPINIKNRNIRLVFIERLDNSD
jgi:hypothetical protein